MASHASTAVLVLVFVFTSVTCQDQLILEFEIALRTVSLTTDAPIATSGDFTTTVIETTSDGSTTETVSDGPSTNGSTDNNTVVNAAYGDAVFWEVESTDGPPAVDEAALESFLYYSYNDTIAFLDIDGIQVSESSRSTNHVYEVVYNLTHLDTGNCPQAENCFVRLSGEIAEVQKSIQNSGANIGDHFEVDPVNTVAKSEDQIQEDIKAELKNTPCTCTREEICYQHEDDEYSIPFCRDICEVYLDEHDGCRDDFFPGSGTEVECRLDDDGDEKYTPYCYCGKSLLLENIYIYDQCQNMSFIVGMSAGILALILLVLFITIGCLACSKNSYKNEAEELRKLRDEEDEEDSRLSGLENPAYGKSWQNPADTRQNKGVTSPQDVRLEPTDSRTQGPYTATYDMPEERREYTRVQNNLNKQNGYGHTNQTYSPEPGAPWDSNSAEISESDAYRNFQPSITHIDPKKDYNIKRPNITVRPMDNFYNMENDKDFPMQSFHI